MRRPVKFRLIYLVIMLLTYVLGFQLIPKTLTNSTEQYLFVGFAVAYFLVLPVLYWYCVIKTGQQKLWRLLIPFSLGALMARYSFPAEFAAYFEFIAWVRYPVIAIIIALEFFVIYSVVKALWQSRKLTGDPRINAAINFAEDDKKRSLSVVMAYEPASWYYCIPRFSRNHPPGIGALTLWSAGTWHWLLCLAATTAVTIIAFWLTASVSELAAYLLAGFIFYGVILLTANYRISRHYSVYLHGENLVVNNSVFGFLVVPLSAIESVSQGVWRKEDNSESLFLGRGDEAQVFIKFTDKQTYYSTLGHVTEEFDHGFLVLNDPQALFSALQQIGIESAQKPLKLAS